MHSRLVQCVVLAPLFLSACGAGNEIEPGVSLQLARQRAAALKNVRYEIHFNIPPDASAPIAAEEAVEFHLARVDGPLVLDFRETPESIHSVRSDQGSLPYRFVNGHIVIAERFLREGRNRIEIEFTAGDGPLNRNSEFLYSLFVPDRASRAFPCFDQPDIKARYKLTLTVPGDWQAVANAPVEEVEAADGRKVIHFGETRPLSTYQFAFAAGDFRVEEREVAGRRMHMYHRETDNSRVRRNRKEIFELHGRALAFLEKYTGIPFPFSKFDFVLIPAFQFGGMEHPGAILYRASGLMLEESATRSQQLGRASVIAHETAHMWFGNLVTMRWFNDVWMKEVFANFMAAKVAEPIFPKMNHALRFLLRHFPGAYSVDRTAGTHPIRQELDNLQNAGTLYGAIIYQKAPIVLKQLENLMGEGAFQEGVREYLQDFAYGNAEWSDLVERLDRRSELDLKRWSANWVEGAGRPTIRVMLETGNGRISSLRLRQEDPSGRGRRWTQWLHPSLIYADSIADFSVLLEDSAVEVSGAKGYPAPLAVLPNGRGAGYGLFLLDEASRRTFLQGLPELERPLHRGAAWIDLWEEMLEGRVSPQDLIETAMALVRREPNELILDRVLADLGTLYWRFTAAESRRELSPRLESLLWRRIRTTHNPRIKAACFATYRNIAVTDEAVERLRQLWAEEREIPGLRLSRRDRTRLAMELAVRGVPDAEQILRTELVRIENPDRKKRLEFVMPALSADPAVREEFFAKLGDVKNRRHEPWVLEGLRYLHHPLRSRHAEKFIEPALEMLEEIQRTGDIFFPKRWLDATLAGHNSPSAAETVHAFLQRRQLPPRLRLKLLQSADGLFRAARIVYGWQPAD